MVGGGRGSLHHVNIDWWWEVGEGACTMSILTGAGRGGLHHVNIDCDFAGSGLQLGAAQNRRSFDDTVCV